MHEFGIAYDVYATARRTALDHAAREVKAVCVEFGEMAMVNPEQVEYLFSVICEDDPLCRGATLTYRKVPPRTRCACGYQGSEIFVCPICGALPEVVEGREVIVTQVKIEVPD